MFPFQLLIYSCWPYVPIYVNMEHQVLKESHKHQTYLHLIRISMTHQGCLGIVHWSIVGALRDKPSDFRGMISDLAKTWNTARFAFEISGIIWIISMEANSYLAEARLKLLFSNLRFCNSIYKSWTVIPVPFHTSLILCYTHLSKPDKILSVIKHFTITKLNCINRGNILHFSFFIHGLIGQAPFLLHQSCSIACKTTHFVYCNHVVLQLSRQRVSLHVYTFLYQHRYCFLQKNIFSLSLKLRLLKAPFKYNGNTSKQNITV